ncbi:MAG: EAL domain-containing protein, partial [Eggerthellaceae bacterium]|nr:EAL domain-containing protein [Eggerthellaceae bacterium]
KLGGDDAPGGVLVYYADGDEEIIYVNQYVIDLFECDSYEDLLELTKGSFRGFVHDEDINSSEDSIWGQVGKHDNLDHIYYRIKTKSGRLVNIEDFGRLVERSGARPVFTVFLIEMKRKDSVDWLTGLPSMVRFHELAEIGAASIRERGDKPVAIALDLVGMKAFNTQYGRDEGDKLLCVFADVLRKHFGSEACSRFSEDHYYAYTAEDGVKERIEALFADFKQANEGNVLPVRAGAYLCDKEDDIVEIGFDRAKIACDLDRKTWQSHVMWFSDDMRAKARLRIHVLDRLSRAIEQGWIRPYYQAIVRSSTGYICGEEALARWDDPEYGMISPAFFIPILEDAGLLHQLDMHMVDCVIADILKERENGVTTVPTSINISVRDLGKVDIAHELARRADAAGVSHDLLRVEFTESAAIEDPAQLQLQIKSLHDAGFKVWMDDFGSGYSSLNTLQEFGFDLIKLDIEFVRNLESERAREVVAGVVRVASKMGVDTLAEGIETEEQALFLESIGCDMLQGFLYFRPVPIDEIIRWVSEGKSKTRESDVERDYWNAVGMADLIDPTANIDSKAADGTPLSEFPAGVMERRGDIWRLVRSNMAYREFLDRGGVIPISNPRLEPNVFEFGVDVEYAKAAKRSVSTGMWERVAGRLEYGTGLQFYTRHVASSPEANAFLLASV